MSATRLATVLQMIETLPDSMQVKVVDHLREYIEDLRNEEAWDAAFQRTQAQLAAAGQRARQQIDQGEATPMNLDDL
jgi:DNA phosphorothioation-dependent restriction protein DptG